MKYLKIATRILGLLLLAFMLSVCLVMGIVPVLPKRKEQAPIEIKSE